MVIGVRECIDQVFFYTIDVRITFALTLPCFGEVVKRGRVRNKYDALPSRKWRCLVWRWQVKHIVIVSLQQGLCWIIATVPETLYHGFFLRAPGKVNLAQVVIADDEFTGFAAVQRLDVVQESAYQLVSRLCKLAFEQVCSLCCFVCQHVCW